MDNGWSIVYTVSSPITAELLRQALGEAGITSVVINQHDSSFQSFGNVEVYVADENLEQAKEIADRFENQ